jgi:hypothetical protein
MSDDFEPWGGGSRLGAYLRKRPRVHYDRGDRAPLEEPFLAGVVTDDAAAEYPLARLEDAGPPARYIPHKYR